MLDLPRFPLSIALAGLGEEPDLRATIEWAADAGFRALQWNGATLGARAKDLSRSARRDAAATLRRAELTCSGVDLWIPPRHFLDPAHVDRAAEAAGDALLLAADLASLTGGRAHLCLALPDDPAAAGVIGALVERARTCDAIIADATWPSAWTSNGVALCIDPATVLLSGETTVSPAKALALNGPAAVCARLSDADHAGRTEPGTGRLDLLAYLATITTLHAIGAPIIDVRGLPAPIEAARRLAARLGQVRLQ